MKVKFFSCHTKNLNWKIVSEPFVKIEVNLIFGRNKKDRAFVPIIGKTDLQNGDLVSLTKNSKGTNLIVPSVSTDDGFLIFLTVEGGFRGGVSLHRNDGCTIIASANASAACESAISVCAIMPVNNDPPSMLVFRESGRYGIKFHIYKCRCDEVIHDVMSKDDYQFLFEGGQDLES